MSARRLGVASGALAAVLCVAGAQGAVAQSMTPMRGVIASESDEFAVRVFPRNTYSHSIVFDVHVYDQNFRRVEAMVWPQHFAVAGGRAAPVTVLVPFAGASQRKVRVCAESVPFPHQMSQIRTQICGKFLAQRSR